jgi:predicted permease
MLRILRHLWASLRRGRLDEQMREELEQHVAWKAEELAHDGVPPAEARRQAAVAVGNLARLREDSRAVWGFPTLDSVAQDVRYGLRQIARAPAFSLVAISSLAIGIGASAAVFSLADAMIFRTLPAVRDPHSLVVFKWHSGPVLAFNGLNGNSDQNEQGMSSTSFARVALDEMQAAGRGSIDVFGFADLYSVNVSIDGRAETLNAHAVSGTYFEVLGVAPAAGRLLASPDDRADAAPAALISDRFWQRRFGGDHAAIGRTLTVNGLPLTIVGVAARGFRGTGQVSAIPDLYVPLAQHAPIARSGQQNDDPNFWWVLLVGRLRPGVETAGMRETLDVVLKRTVASARPAMDAKDLPRLELLPGAHGQHEDRSGMRDPLRTLAVAVGIVLLVACANVANLLLARGRARLRELAVRAAIGAARARVVRQLFTEALVLAALGAGLGVAVAHWIAAALLPTVTGQPAEAILRLEGRILGMPGLDWRVLAFAIVLAGGCAVLFGLAPALRSTSATLLPGLQEASRRGPGGARRGRLTGALVVVQIALSMVLVVTAALLVRSVRNLDRVDLGFDAANLLVFRVDPSQNGYTPDRIRALCARLLEDLRGAPGVLNATFTSHPLLAHSASIGIARTESEPALPSGTMASRAYMRDHTAWRLVTGPGFFETLRLPILRGRPLDDRDAAGGQRVVVVNTILARQLFKSDDAVGRRFYLGGAATGQLYEIVGVAGAAKYRSVRDEPPPTVYLTAAPRPPGAATFEVRVAGDAAAFAATAREIVRGIDDQLPLVDVRTMADQVARSLRQERLFARLTTLLGAVTLALSAIGLYGLLAYGVAQRVPEIGLRMALGAGRGAVRWMVLRQSLLLAVPGLVAGVAGAVAATRLVESMLYRLPPRDPVTIAAAAAIMLVTCALAGHVPARRASRVDPMVALRAE